MTMSSSSGRTTNGVLLVAFLLLGACSTDKDAASASAGDGANTAATAASNQGEEDLADVTKYRLSMDKIDKLFAAQRNIAIKAKGMSPAEREALESRAGARDDNNASVDDMVRNIESEPMMVSAIRDAGLSPREYIILTVSMMQSAMAAGVAKMRPNDNQDSLIREMKANPENVKFINENEAELARKQKAMADEMKKLGIDTES
jgi:hypothetical protein